MATMQKADLVFWARPRTETWARDGGGSSVQLERKQ